MKASDVPRLDKLLRAMAGWRAAVAQDGGELRQLIVDFGDGRPVVFAWNAELNDWEITTG